MLKNATADNKANDRFAEPTLSCVALTMVYNEKVSVMGHSGTSETYRILRGVSPPKCT